MWSVGCIYAELLGRTPLFPGKNFVHQLELIFDVIGTPRKEEAAYIKNAQAITFLRNLKPKRGVPFHTLYPSAVEPGLSLLRSCLTFEATARNPNSKL